MTNSTSTYLKLASIAAALFIFALPASAFAAIHISSVMYDPPGADQGHEWIELTNTGGDPVNLFNYRLYEGGTNHKLVASVGTSTIAAGAKAIITTDPAQYSADHPSFVGTVFKSSFSLSNSGETIELRDAKLITVDSYSYTAPPAVKKAAPVKASKTSKAKSSAANYSYTATDQAAALPLAASTMPAIPQLSNALLYGLGLAALLILGIGAALFIRPLNSRSFNETSLMASEFNIE